MSAEMEERLNVINALKQSSKLKHWDKPPRDYGPENPEHSDYNRNGLKDVGDLSRINFSPQFSFGIEGESIEVSQPDDDKIEEPTEFLQQSFYSVEGTSRLGHVRIPSSLEIARKAQEQYELQKLLERLSLEKKYKQAIQRKTKLKHEAYWNFLSKIHAQHEEEREKYLIMQKEKLKHEENRLRKQEEEELRAVQIYKREYTSHVSRNASELLEAVESARRQEAEQASLLQSLMIKLQTSYATFVSKLEVMHQAFRELEGIEILDKSIEAFLNQTRAQVEDVVKNTHQRIPSPKQVDDAQKSLQQGLRCVESIIQNLEAKKVEKANLEAQRIQEEIEKAKLKAAQQEIERQQEALRKQESIENEQKIEEKIKVVPDTDKMDRLMELKQKVNYFLEAHEKLSKDKLWDVRRKATIANQLSKDDQSINRDKLQKLLNNMRETKNEPDVHACYKNLIAINVIKQIAMLDALGASAYSWLLVELVTFYPDMWDLFLYYLFKNCSPLMPGTRTAEESQKNIEKPDVYYSQVGKYSMMYGLVLARISKKQSSPVRAAAIGWEVLANIISQPPLSGITGEVLLKFLQSFGYTLQQTYMKQFVKLMEYIDKCYITQIKEATVKGGQNCLTLLQNFMGEYKPNKLTQNALLNKFI